MMQDIMELIDENKPFIIIGKGHSMWPMLKPDNNLIKIFPIDKPLKKYDVVLFKDGNNYKVHRIIDIKDDKYTLSGDSTLLLEKDIKRSDILGIVYSFVSNRKKNKLKWIDTDNWLYLIYSRLVVWLMPIRRGLLYLYYNILRK